MKAKARDEALWVGANAGMILTILIGSTLSDKTNRSQAENTNQVAKAETHWQEDGAWRALAIDGIERAEYQCSATRDGLGAPNRAHGFRIRYRPHEVQLVPREVGDGNPWSISWHTTAWGRAGQLRLVNPNDRALRIEDSRVVYDMSGLREWYVNDEQRLEQGFDLERRPEGAGSLPIEGALEGGLRPVLREDGEVDLLDASGRAVLRYGKLARSN